MSEELMQKILEILVRKKRYAQQDFVDAKEIDQELNIGLDYVREALDRMEYLGLIKILRTGGNTYNAEILPKGLLVYDNLGKKTN